MRPSREIAIESGQMSKTDNPLKSAPHTAFDLVDWERSYPAKLGVYPAGIDNGKYWCPVNRVDNVYGDRHLVCTLPLDYPAVDPTGAMFGSSHSQKRSDRHNRSPRDLMRPR